MRNRLLFTLLIGYTTLPAFAAELGDPSVLAIPPQVSKRAGELIVILGGKDADKRNEAYKELDKLGRQALPAIEAALKGKPDAELKTNLDRLRGPAMKEQFKAAYSIFLADKENKYHHDFPFWNELVAIVKDSKDSRKLMRDMLSDEDVADFFARVCTDRDRAHKEIDDRWLNLGRKKEDFRGLPSYDYMSIKVCKYASILLAECVIPGEIKREFDNRGNCTQGAGSIARNRTFPNLGLKNPINIEFTEELTGSSKYGESFRLLCKHWIVTRTTDQGLYAARAMCDEFKFDASLMVKCWELTFAIPNNDSISLCTAMHYLAKTGDQKYLKEFQKQFNNKSKSSSYLPIEKAEVRDHALLYSILITNQKPAEYGFRYQFDDLPKQNKKEYESNCFNYLFKSDESGSVDEKRKRAFSKWGEWENKANTNK